MNWILLWATLQCGFVPLALDNGISMANVEYVEPGFGATLFGFLTVEGSIRTYFKPDGIEAWLPQFSPLRDTYTIGARIDPTAWLRVGALHWCGHAVAPHGNVQWPGDQAATEFYVRLKIGD